jgi:hypothetical protein
MRSPIERQLAFHTDACRQRRLAEGRPLDETALQYLRARWPQRMACGASCGPGWTDLLQAVNELLDAWGAEDLVFADVKEKYAELRLSFFGDDQGGRIDELFSAAEEISQGICETCGARAKVRSGFAGWLSSTCDEHAAPSSKIVRVVWESRS